MAKRIVTDNYLIKVDGRIELPPIDNARPIVLPVAAVVHPRRLGDQGWMSGPDRMFSSNIEGDYRRRCEEIARDLTAQYPGLRAVVECDTREECSHCGRVWEEFTAEDAELWPDWNEPIGLPQCCGPAQAEFRAGVA
ncbi:hypothetical protein ACFVFS_05800 [Kitasatospora sp. NPDC057692]|uniref:hypothetical protein n=1 Tax=Kitasatospora sp. NPDC057692 TaxID=3346215 RepID=UPI0036C0881E